MHQIQLLQLIPEIFSIILKRKYDHSILSIKVTTKLKVLLVLSKKGLMNYLYLKGLYNKLFMSMGVRKAWKCTCYSNQEAERLLITINKNDRDIAPSPIAPLAHGVWWKAEREQ